MGLDMYLEADKFVSIYQRKLQYDKLVDAVREHMCTTPIPIAKNASSATLSIEVMYWRKANAIHRWFVDNVQDGVDDCRRAFVSRENLVELLDVCEKTLLAKADGNDPADYLPTRDVFLFGSIDYNEYFWDTIERTAVEVERLLEWISREEEANNFWQIFYQSSW